MREILAKLRKYEIRIRKAVNAQMRGDFHSVFKGSGLEFSDVRAYQYGDDVRSIDWNVSAKGNGTFVKIFKEEKEQTIFFMVDVSASQEIGKRTRRKLDVAKEICGVLALSAVKEDSHAGLYCFSDQKEKYIRPGKGIKQGYEIVMNLFNLQPVSVKTDLAKAIRFALIMLKRKSVVILISDFISEDYEHNLKALARKHDLVVIHLYDQRETNLPSLGIIPLYDQESRKTIWLNTSSKAFKREMNGIFSDNQKRLEQLCKQYKASYLAVNTEEDFVPKLVKLFRVR
ncbi:MAG: DUF58 domain-containing protein [Bacteroidota bacterium]